MADIIVTCEHAADHIPPELRKRMQIPADIDQHRTYDKGALEAAKAFASRCGVIVYDFPVSRLLIDANRSISNRNIFSSYARNLTEYERLSMLKEHYIPFRMPILKEIAASKEVIHLSFHSFTPVMNGRVRELEIGILYDPARGKEAETAKGVISHLADKTGLRVRSNKPYKGTADGHTTALRREFPESKYSGIEIELSQKLSTDEMKNIARTLAAFFK